MVILIIIKDGKRLVYAEHGMTRLFETKAEALKLGKDIYGDSLQMEAIFLYSASTAVNG